MIDDEHENVNGSVGTTSKLSRHFKIKPSNVAKINLKERTPPHEHQLRTNDAVDADHNNSKSFMVFFRPFFVSFEGRRDG